MTVEHSVRQASKQSRPGDIKSCSKPNIAHVSAQKARIDTKTDRMGAQQKAHFVSWKPLKLPVATNRLSSAGHATARHRRYAKAWPVISGEAPILVRKKGAI